MAIELPKELLEGIPDAILVLDADGTAVFSNAAANDLFGTDLQGKKVGVPLDDFSVVKIPRKGELREAELRVSKTDEYLAGSSAVVLRDVTEREKLKGGLESKITELNGLAELLQVIPSPLVRANGLGEIEWANAAFKQTFGDLKTVGDVPALASDPAKVASLFDTSDAKRIREVVFESGLEQNPPLLVQSVALTNTASPGVGGHEFAVIINTRLESQELLKTYMNAMYFDQGLGVSNLRGLVLQGTDDWANANLEQAALAVSFQSIDAIDQELVSVRIVELIRSQWQTLGLGDVTMRIGRVAADVVGCILAANRESEVGASAALDRLQKLILERGMDRINIGLVSDTRAAPSLDAAIEEALIASQEARQLGEPSHSFKEDYSEIMQGRRDLAEAVRRAVSEKSFRMVLQPRIGLKSGKIEGAEVLARLKDPKLGDISPDVFVPILKRFNLVSDLTQLMGQRALTQIQDWKARSVPIVSLSINIAPGDVSSNRALSVLRSLAREFSEGTSLELEMSEMDPFPLESHVELKALLKNLGIELALDDFGKGYSSFSYLVSLPISVIKIDKSFADDLLLPERKAASIALYRSIVALARELRIMVCAEGVEEQSQVDELSLLGVDQIQGYVFSKALEISAFEKQYLIGGDKNAKA